MPTHDTTEPRSKPGAVLVSDRWESEVEPRLPQELEVQAKQPGALQRKRGLSSAAQLGRARLSSVLCAPSFRRIGAGDWLGWRLCEWWAVPPPSGWLAERGGGGVLASDGTALRQVGGSGDDWRLPTAYDLRAGRPEPGNGER